MLPGLEGSLLIARTILTFISIILIIHITYKTRHEGVLFLGIEAMIELVTRFLLLWSCLKAGDLIYSLLITANKIFFLLGIYCIWIDIKPYRKKRLDTIS